MVLRNVSKVDRTLCDGALTETTLNVTKSQHGSKGILKVREYR
jgi:hypothetical protein